MSKGNENRASGFWGLILEPGKRYTKLVDIPFQITAAVLDSTAAENAEDEIVAVMLEVDGMEITICNLSRKKGILQCPLNLKFEEGSRIAFYSTGVSMAIHLSGNIIGNKNDYSAVAMKSKGKFTQNKRKRVADDNLSPKKIKSTELKKTIEELALKKNMTNDDDEEEEEEEDDSALEEEEESLSEEDDSEEEESEEEGKEILKDVVQMLKDNKAPKAAISSSSSDEALKTPKKKKKKMIESTPSNKNKSPASQKTDVQKKVDAVNGTPVKQQSSENSKAGANTQTPSKSPKVIKMGGVTCEDLIVGAGKEAKLGKNVKVYYEGRLASNKKMFDSCLSGPPFKFRLGESGIIQGWNVGVAGMKVGGKRKIVVPPHLAYGKRGMPPDIPPKSTLIFVVQLKSMG